MHWLKDKVRHKFAYAFCGLLNGIRHDSSIALQFILGLITILVCLFFSLSALVITAEFINSAIEKTVDYISLERHPQAKAIKDLSAAAVLLISICAFCIAVIILGGKLL